VIGAKQDMQIQLFEDLPLSKEILHGIENLGFSTLFPIQAEAIIPLLEGKDVIGQAQTGTGKTAAFSIPMVQNLNQHRNTVQGLILEPTRELAIQTAKHISRLCKYTKIKILPIYGGTSIQRQIRALERGIHIVVATPGRIIDHIKRRTIDLSSVRIVVLDEADRMLDMGFIEDLEYILAKVPVNRQTSLFSATIDRSVLKISHKYMKTPEKILVSKDEIAVTRMIQYYMMVNPKEKLEILCELIEENHIERAIFFCKTRRRTNILTKRLRDRRYDARPLHGGLTQSQRDFVVNSFRKGELNFLVATDVAARGLDIQGITHIINYDIPLDPLVYFHRIGRTARVGLGGTAITLVGYGERTELKRIKVLTKTELKELHDPHKSFRDSSKVHEAVCTECGKKCEVPFKPDPKRPIYCKSCWSGHNALITNPYFSR
jgi:ATP-dependent RNA helicase DeaD